MSIVPRLRRDEQPAPNYSRTAPQAAQSSAAAPRRSAVVTDPAPSASNAPSSGADGRFAKVPVDLLLLGDRLAIRLYAILAGEYADYKTCIAVVRRAQLAADVGTSLPTVDRRLRILDAAGWVRVAPRPPTRSPSGHWRGHASTYVLRPGAETGRPSARFVRIPVSRALDRQLSAEDFHREFVRLVLAGGCDATIADRSGVKAVSSQRPDLSIHGDLENELNQGSGTTEVQEQLPRVRASGGHKCTTPTERLPSTESATPHETGRHALAPSPGSAVPAIPAVTLKFARCAVPKLPDGADLNEVQAKVRDSIESRIRRGELPLRRDN
jgi:hypothetical protein